MAGSESPTVVILVVILFGAILSAYPSPLQGVGIGILIIGLIFLVVYLYSLIQG